MRTATLITTRLALLRLGLPALIALVFAFGALTSASAAQSADALPVAGYAPADDHEADGDAADTEDGDSDDGDSAEGAGQARKLARLSDVEAVLALCSGDGDAPAFDNPSLSILCDVYPRLGGVLPSEVMRGLARAIAVHADQVAHGWRERLASSDVATRLRANNAAQLCRRVLHDALDGDSNTDAADGLLARCRAFLTGDGTDDGSLSAAEICTLLAGSGVLDRSPSLGKRCRAAVGGGDQDVNAASARVCIRLREAGAAEDHPVLARRCHNLADGLDGGGGDDGDDGANGDRRRGQGRGNLLGDGGDDDDPDDDENDGDESEDESADDDNES